MGLSYETAAKLFEQGEFAKIVGLSTRDERERQALEPRHRVILANALAFVGEFKEAKRLADVDANGSSAAAARSQAEWTLSLAHRRLGDLDSALRHAQAAVQLAQESGEVGKAAWAHLH